MAERQEETIKREKGRLLNFIRTRVNNTEDAEDILQDVFFQFVDAYDTIGSIEKATAWLFRVARNKIVDSYRKQKVRSNQMSFVQAADDGEEPLMLSDILPDLGQTPEDMHFRDIIWEAVTAALGELPADQRDIFIQHELEDRSFKELSEQYNIPVNTLISRKRYAVLALRKKLETLYDEI
ncbi:Putative RNA polymerase sigma factor [Fulvivirga imtechensis AK7]|uniref:Putative RNA polymerase sigma factor n=1 Tax=Fulvivirga imtechensis AK7 TaxID=1237149 RepID=L8JXK6_9BACT|nr:RNA polymerase sigma factor [Fulvivirga imtechensis]ELR72359.1 Putative RNA polymerase sigma factor [Fulvivirga imtechensis AK7]